MAPNNRITGEQIKTKIIQYKKNYYIFLKELINKNGGDNEKPPHFNKTGHLIVLIEVLNSI